MGRRLPVPALLGGLLAAYLVVPVALILTRLGPGQWQGLGDHTIWSALGTSVLAATTATAVTAVTGVPLAWVLARRRRPGWSRRAWSAVGALVQLPLALPPLVSGLLLLRVVGPYTFLGRHSGQRLTESLWGIVLAQIFVAGPFLVVSARGAFAAVDPTLDGVAATLGHRPLARWFRVDLAEAAAGVRAGLVLTWLRAFGEFGATVLLAYHPYSLPVYSYVAFDSAGLRATQVPVDLAVVTAAAVVALGQVRRRRRGAGQLAGRRPPAPPKVTAGVPAPVGVRRGPLDFAVGAAAGGFTLEAAYRCRSRRLALLGPSGAGKSITLELLAGLRTPASGWVRLGPEDLSGLPPERRGIGYVPQGGGLLPRLDVWRQVTFGVEADPGEAVWWLERLRVAGLEARHPDELSGGQAQRVALARALASRGRLLLLDEPLSALDTPVRRALGHELRRLQADRGLDTVVVTHDPEEAAALADEIVVLDAGRVLQAGPRRQLFQRPASVDVARLLGLANVQTGTLTAPGLVAAGRLGLVQLATARPSDPGAGEPPPGGAVLWSVEPEALSARSTGDHRAGDGSDGMMALVLDVVDVGRFREAILDLGDGVILASRHPSVDSIEAGAAVRLDLPPVEVWAAGPPLARPWHDDVGTGGEPVAVTARQAARW
ncbi:MAG: ATP-binding cassette domain-containing protein [Acidimicrobiales bacterium]